MDLWVLICAFSLFIQLSEVIYHVNKRIMKGYDSLRMMNCQTITPF